ncbi:hypothetical protein Hanom_Chr05g00454861 [Helianthus anomalus]
MFIKSIYLLNDQTTPVDKDKKGEFKQSKMRDFKFWTKMTKKCKPQGTRCNKFEILTKMTKLTKPQEPEWQFTLISISLLPNFFSLHLKYNFSPKQNSISLPNIC